MTEGEEESVAWVDQFYGQERTGNRYPRETGWPRRWAVKIGKQARLASFIVPPFVSASRY